MKFYNSLIVLTLSLTLLNCGKKDEAPEAENVFAGEKDTTFSVSDEEAEYDTYRLIQEKIFNTSCVGCHTEGGSFARESGLVLDPAVSYDNLVGKNANNQKAASENMLLVTPKSPEKSLLFKKLDPKTVYGAYMPLGRDPVTVGQAEFIKQWIEAGAPETGKVVDDLSLLTDTTVQEKGEFKTLAKPEKGFQVDTGKFEVKNNFEREMYVIKDLGNTEEVYVQSIEMKMRGNSHHLIVWKPRADTPESEIPEVDKIRDLHDPNGNTDFSFVQREMSQDFVSTSQTPYLNFKFPKGVALPLKAFQKLDINAHYINLTDKSIYGQAVVNFHTVDKSEVKHLAKQLFLFNSRITLPKGKKTTIKTQYPVKKKIHIFVLSSHFHELGKEYKINLIRQGKREEKPIYISKSWNNPLYKDYTDPIILEPGDVIESETTWENKTNEDVFFGLKRKNEMDIILGYYY